jgi:uncharacterized protein (TIGR00297 family)
MFFVEQVMVWLSSIVVMTIFAYKINVIDKYGALTAIPIGFIILYFGATSWFIVLLLFFLIASLFTKYKYKQKQRMGVAEENNGARGWRNVLANGGPLATIAILYYISHNDPIFMLCFVGSISFALSDTIATELGLLSKVKPRSLLTGKQIEKGQSGGVTIQGEIAALIGSLLIGTICGLLISENISLRIPIILLAAIVGGMISTNIDSIFGATIQAKYRCINCRKSLEKRSIHCNFPTIQEKGISIVNNNTVNLISAIIGAIISANFIILYE